MVRQYSYSVNSMHGMFQVSSRSDEFGRCRCRHPVAHTPSFLLGYPLDISSMASTVSLSICIIYMYDYQTLSFDNTSQT
jgi:hypothetical protein